jgi:hypothetical protein
MVWGGIFRGFRVRLLQCPALVTAESDMKMLADNHIFVLIIQQFCRNVFIFQGDNASPHQPYLPAIQR